MYSSFSLEELKTDEPWKYDIVWTTKKKDTDVICSKYNRIRGYNKHSTNVANTEEAIYQLKFILETIIPQKKEEYINFKELAESSLLPNSIKPLTSAYSSLLEVYEQAKKELKNFQEIENDFCERERAWFEFTTWGPRGFMIDVMHDLECIEGFENSDYYDEAIFIINKFRIRL